MSITKLTVSLSNDDDRYGRTWRPYEDGQLRKLLSEERLKKTIKNQKEFCEYASILLNRTPSAVLNRIYKLNTKSRKQNTIIYGKTTLDVSKNKPFLQNIEDAKFLSDSDKLSLLKIILK